MNNVIKEVVEKIYPTRYQLALRYRYGIMANTLDDEMFYADTLLKRRRRFVDIGANIGIYTYYYSSRMKRVDSFEPLREVTNRIQSLSMDSITIHDIALSNMKDELTLFIPHDKYGQMIPSSASVEPRGGSFDKRDVKVSPLDDFEFDDVDLIKIDVEGHEANVLEGAVKTIESSKPIIIVEIEQRHIESSIDSVIEKFSSLSGYDGYFLDNDSLVGVDSFSYSVHQKPYLADVMDKRYKNNFIFKHSTA